MIRSHAFSIAKFKICLLTGILFGFGAPSSEAQQRRVIQLEIAASNRAETSIQQRWMEVLSKVGADRVRSRTAFGSVSPKVEEMNLSGTISIVVTGVISNRILHLPGGRYKMSDAARIRDYLDKLRDDGAKVALAEKKAFGLTSEQLVDVHKELSTVVKMKTRGVETGEVVKRIASLLKTRIVPDRQASRMLAGSFPVLDELDGLAAGTALAAALRPLGLVLQPYRDQGKPIEFRIVDARKADENWPVGWPIDKPVSLVEPKLMKKLSAINIRGYPLKEILQRFEQRVGVPFIFDQNTMAREGIELDSVKVTLVKKNTPYLLAISNLLSQTDPKMKQEIRVDENGVAFVWISTPG